MGHIQSIVELTKRSLRGIGVVGRLAVIEGKWGGPKDKKEGSDSLGGEGREKKTSGLESCVCHCSCCCPL